MDMSYDFKNRLEQYIWQEQALLDQLLRLKGQQVDVGAEVGKTIISEGMAALAKDFFESSVAGRLGRKITKTFINQKQKEQLLIQERNIEAQHNSLVHNVRILLSSISIKRANLKEPNSFKLVARLDRVQEFVKVETRIKRTVMVLRDLANKPLIDNKDIPPLQLVKEVIVPPSKPFTSAMKIKEILQNAQGYVKVIDPYVDKTTLEFLLNVPEGLSIKLLTQYTGGEKREGPFKRACQMFKVERPQFEIRKCDKLIHDRFILTQTQGWSIGSSLKDIGKRLSMINEISTQTKHEIEKTFDQIWSKSADLLT